MNDSTVKALTGFLPYVLPEAVLGVMACVLFLGGSLKYSRGLWGFVALVSLALAGVGLWESTKAPTAEALKKEFDVLKAQGEDVKAAQKEADLKAMVFASPVQHNRLALLFKVVALVGGAVLVLFSWDEAPLEHAADYHGCLLLVVAGLCVTAGANDLITLFLALELVSIPTYVLLYLPREDAPAQEAALKYFMLSVFSSGLLLFGFSYLYGLTGTTNLPGLADALVRARVELAGAEEAARKAAAWPGLALLASLLVVAGLGFRLTVVPFHFYAPDVYQGTTTGMAAFLAFVPKVAGLAAMVRVLGFVPSPFTLSETAAQTGGGSIVVSDQLPMLLWIIAAVTMSLGNLLALLQDNLKRMLAYSSVAHAGYMLIGLTVAPWLSRGPGESVGGVEATTFYLIAYGAMTVGAFAVLHYLNTSSRPVETVDDLAGVGRTHPGMALVMALFMFSLIGIPLTAGFVGKFFLFFAALGIPSDAGAATRTVLGDMPTLYRVLAVIGVVNAAIGAWYYLRIVAVMYLRDPVYAPQSRRSAPLVLSIFACAALTLFLGIYPTPVLKEVQSAVPRPLPSSGAPVANAGAPQQAMAGN